MTSSPPMPEDAQSFSQPATYEDVAWFRKPRPSRPSETKAAHGLFGDQVCRLDMGIRSPSMRATPSAGLQRCFNAVLGLPAWSAVPNVRRLRRGQEDGLQDSGNSEAGTRSQASSSRRFACDISSLDHRIPAHPRFQVLAFPLQVETQADCPREQGEPKWLRESLQCVYALSSSPRAQSSAEENVHACVRAHLHVQCSHARAHQNAHADCLWTLVMCRCTCCGRSIATCGACVAPRPLSSRPTLYRPPTQT